MQASSLKYNARFRYLYEVETLNSQNIIRQANKHPCVLSIK